MSSSEQQGIAIEKTRISVVFISAYISEYYKTVSLFLAHPCYVPTAVTFATPTVSFLAGSFRIFTEDPLRNQFALVQV